MRIGSVCYATEQGLGRLMRSFYDAGIVTDPVIVRHSAWTRKTHANWYPPGTPVVEHRRSFDPKVIGPVVDAVDCMLFFETPFDWSLLDYCRDRGVKTALMPMYEWTPVKPPALPDLWLCPSLLDLDYFRDWPGTKAVYLPVPVEGRHWVLRRRADRFLHNAGNIGHREHKGTRQLLEAVPMIRNPDFRLTVRAQDASALKRIVRACPAAYADKRVEFGWGEQPYETLWDDHDVYVAPEKFNGLSLPLREACAAGLVVMTTDRYPTNTWLPKEPLIPPIILQKERISQSYLEFDEAVVDPKTIAAKIEAWVGQDIEALSRAGKTWAEENSWKVLRPKYLEVFEELVRG